MKSSAADQLANTAYDPDSGSNWAAASETDRPTKKESLCSSQSLQDTRADLKGDQPFIIQAFRSLSTPKQGAQAMDGRTSGANEETHDRRHTTE